MPLYTFRCKDCGKDHEEIMSWLDFEQSQPERCGQDTSEHGCGGEIYRVWVAPPAHSTWNTTGQYGVDGYYSKALGKHVSSPHTEKKIMESRGFVCEADLPQHRWDDAVETQQQRVKQQDTYINTYTEALKSGKTKEEAVVEAFPARDAVSGKLDETFGAKK